MCVKAALPAATRAVKLCPKAGEPLRPELLSVSAIAGNQLRRSNKPSSKPMAAAMPTAPHGFSRT
jgi:hypothetical protein